MKVKSDQIRVRMSLPSLCAAQEVLQPPTFVQKLLNSRALEGDTMSLECKIDASPTPQVFWKKDKEMLHIDPSRMRLVLTSISSFTELQVSARPAQSSQPDSGEPSVVNYTF